MKKNSKNAKGFTLVELLAVIIVLAIIMVLAIPSVFRAMNSAQKKSFNMFAQKMVKIATETYESQKLISEVPSKKPSGMTAAYSSNAFCYTFSDLNLTATGYTGIVVVEPTNALSGDKYYIYLTNGTFSYVGTEGTTIQEGMDDLQEMKDDKPGDTGATAIKAVQLTTCDGKNGAKD